MYRGLTVKYSRLCRVQPLVQRRRLQVKKIPAFPAPSCQPAQRAVERWDGSKPERRPIPGQFSSRDGLEWRYGPDYPVPLGTEANLGERASAPKLGRWQRNKGGIAVAICPDGPTLDAPDCIAYQNPRPTRGHAARQLRWSCSVPGLGFGAALLLAFRPSHHPRIRWAVASPGSAARASGCTRPPPPRV